MNWRKVKIHPTKILSRTMLAFCIGVTLVTLRHVEITDYGKYTEVVDRHFDVVSYRAMISMWIAYCVVLLRLGSKPKRRR